MIAAWRERRPQRQTVPRYLPKLSSYRRRIGSNAPKPVIGGPQLPFVAGNGNRRSLPLAPATINLLV